MEVIKEKGKVSITKWISNKDVVFEKVPYKNYVMYKGYKLVFTLSGERGKLIQSLTESSTGGACVTKNEVEINDYEAFLSKFEEKLVKAEELGRNFDRVVEDYKEQINKCLYGNIETIDTWKLSLML